MNRFIQLNMSGNIFNMTFIDSLEDYYKDETELPVQEPSSTSSPFKGKSPHECYLLLKRLIRETESQIDWQEFVIVDERSLKVSHSINDTIYLNNTVTDSIYQ